MKRLLLASMLLASLGLYGSNNSFKDDGSGPGPTVTFAISDAFACVNNGVIWATDIQGVGPFNSTMLVGGIPIAGPMWTQLAPGTYVVTVTDGLGCSVSFTHTIGIQPISAVLGTVTHASAGCIDDGAITLILSAPHPQLIPNITWTLPGGATTNNVNLQGLSGGTYTWQALDTFGCNVGGGTVIINQPPQPSIIVDAVEPESNCTGLGSINVTLTPAGIDTQWTGDDGFESLLEDVDQLSAGGYTLTATDDNGCTAMVQVMVPFENCLGDFNGDCLVNSSDFLLWSSNYGEPNFEPFADLNDDGVVDDADLQILRDQFGVDCSE